MKRRYFWSRAAGGWCPVDAIVGIHKRTVTTRACCFLSSLGVIYDFKHVGPAGAPAAMATLRKTVRSTQKKKRLRLLRNNLTERWEMLDYRRALALGWDIGSGPTETMCKNLMLELKRAGMTWDPSNAAAVMNLVAPRESDQWDKWWIRCMMRQMMAIRHLRPFSRSLCQGDADPLII